MSVSIMYVWLNAVNVVQNKTKTDKILLLEAEYSL